MGLRAVRKSSVIAHVAIIAVALLAWEWAGLISPKVQFLFGRPRLILRALFTGLQSGNLGRDFMVTGTEALLGFLIGTLVGTLIGLLLWNWPRLAAASSPYLAAFGAIPLFALAPIMIVWFGTGIDAKIAMAALSTVGVALAQAHRGTLAVDVLHLRLMASFGASRWAVFRKVVVPTALVWVASGARLNVGFAILGAFIGEFLSASSGLGYSILRAGGLYDMPQVIAGILALIVLSYLMRGMVAAIERLWHLPRLVTVGITE